MALVFVELQTDLHSFNLPMGLASFPFSKLSCKMFSNSLPLICKPTTSHPSCIHLKNNHKDLIQRPFPIRYKCLSIMAFRSKKSASGEEDKRALETVLKLYTALRNRNITELSEVIGEECRCVCNFTSIFQPFHGKKVISIFAHKFEKRK